MSSSATPDYWNTQAYPFQRVTVTPIPDNVARINALRSGQVDGVIASTKEVKQAEATGLKVHFADINFIGLTLADR